MMILQQEDALLEIQNLKDLMSTEYLILQDNINNDLIDEIELKKSKVRMKDLEDILIMIAKTEDEVLFNIELTIDANKLN